MSCQTARCVIEDNPELERKHFRGPCSALTLPFAAAAAATAWLDTGARSGWKERFMYKETSDILFHEKYVLSLAVVIASSLRS